MMNRILSPLLKEVDHTVALPKCDQYISDLNIKKETVLKRYTSLKTETQGISLLKYIIYLAEVKLTSKLYKTNIDKILNGINPILDELERVFHPVYSGKYIRHGFFSKNTKTKELILPVRTNLLDIDSLSFFQLKNKPVLRLVYTDTNELSFNINGSKITHFTDIPKLSIFTIDVPLLIYQYMLYLEFYNYDPPLTIEEYLNRYVLLNNILDDLLDVWILNRYKHILTYPSRDSFSKKDIEKSIYNNIYGYINLQYTSAMDEVYRQIILKVKRGTLKPNIALSSFPLSTQTLKERFKDLYDSLSTYNLRQYDPLALITYMAYVDVIYKTFNLRETVFLKNYIKRLSKEVDLIDLSNLQNNIPDKITKNIYLKDLNTLKSYIKK